MVEIAGQVSNAQYGSDLVAELLSRLDIPYVAMNPGQAFAASTTPLSTSETITRS